MAGLYRIFAWTESSYGTGADLSHEPVRIHGGTLVYPEWWGAKGVNPENKLAMADDDALLRACRNFKRVLLSKRYRLTKPLRLEEGTEIEGLGYHTMGTGDFGPGFYIDEGFQAGGIHKLLFTPASNLYERVMLEKFNIEVEGTNDPSLVLMCFPGASERHVVYSRHQFRAAWRRSAKLDSDRQSYGYPDGPDRDQHHQHPLSTHTPR